ncbi:MAG: hypothetical protein K1X86_14385 [Ignavibacteria bacterium]|nr:hypothetical protein [Ignavibacteria bacterium]
MIKSFVSKLKKYFNVHFGKTMLIDKEGELWTLNEKDEAVNLSKDSIKPNGSPKNANKNSLAKK